MSASQKYVPYLGKVAFRFVPCSAVSPVYSSVCVNCINTRSEMPKAHACFLRDFNWWKTASCLDATCCHCPSSYLIPAHFSWIQASWCPQMYVKMIEWPHTKTSAVGLESGLSVLTCLGFEHKSCCERGLVKIMLVSFLFKHTSLTRSHSFF